MRFFTAILILILFTCVINAQEVITELSTNPQIKKQYELVQSQAMYKSDVRESESVLLPFFETFAPKNIP